MTPKFTLDETHNYLTKFASHNYLTEKNGIHPDRHARKVFFSASRFDTFPAQNWTAGAQPNVKHGVFKLENWLLQLTQLVISNKHLTKKTKRDLSVDRMDGPRRNGPLSELLYFDPLCRPRDLIVFFGHILAPEMTSFVSCKCKPPIKGSFRGDKGHFYRSAERRHASKQIELSGPIRSH